MDKISFKPAGVRFAFWAFFIPLFLFFTPFEYGPVHSTFPRYLTVAVSVVMLVPLAIIKKISLRVPSVLVLVVLSTILFHSIVINSIPPQFTFLIVANLLLAILMYEVSFHWRKQFVAAVSWLLIINAAVIAMQSLLFYTFSFGIYDFHKMLFGSDSRFAEDFLNIARFSGMQVEPGTYANYVACLLAILIIIFRFSRKNVVDVFLSHHLNIPDKFGLIHLLRSRAECAGGISLEKKNTSLSYRHSCCCNGPLFALSGVLVHLENRFFERDDGSLSHRLEGVHAYMSKSLEDKFFGVGFDKDPCVRCYYQDIGVTFNLLTRGGAIVALALVVLLFRLVKVNGVVLSTILFLIPLNEKMFFYEAPIWLFFLFAMTGRRNAKSAKAVRANVGQLRFGRP